MDRTPMSWRMSSAAMVSAADAALGEGHVLGDGRVQVVAHHQHVQVFVDGIDGVGRVGLVELGSTPGRPASLMMSGAWPPLAPSVWKVGCCGP